MSYEIVGGCVASSQIAPALRTLQAETGCAYQSVYRGQDAAALIHKTGHHTQAEVYYEYTHGLEPNPANPPGRSTHECRSDGVPYPGPIGRVLEPWQCGIDVDDPHVEPLIAAAGRHGWVLFRPYASGSEHHHVNFAAQPRSPVIDLRVGDSGNLVLILSTRLRILGFMRRKSRMFGRNVHGAVVKFQHGHYLQADGVVGPRTWSLLKQLAEQRVRRGGG